jgi:hypothetical protein
MSPVFLFLKTFYGRNHWQLHKKRISLPIRFLHISYTVLLFIEAACGEEKRLEILFLLMKLTRNRCC